MIYDIRELTNLRTIAQQFDVRFKLIGSIPRRVLLSRFADGIRPESLFSLSPFLSDIDLVHSGAPEITPKIVQEIFYRIPFAEAFRWQITSSQERVAYDEFLQQRSHRVPDNMLRLDDHQLHDPADAAGDYERRIFRFGYNERYDASGLPHGDLPLFAVLLYIRNVLQARPWLKGLELWDQPAQKDIRRAVADSATENRMKELGANRYLQNRLFYLFSALVSASPDANYLEDVLGWSGIFGILDILLRNNDRLGSAFHAVREGFRSKRARIVSAAIPNSMRASDVEVPEWEAGRIARRRLARYIGFAALDESDIPLLVSSPIRVEPGIAACSRLVADEIHELMHVDIPITPEYERVLADYPEERLGIALALCEGTSNDDAADVRGAIVGLPTSCSYRDGSRREGSALQIRFNCYGFLEKAYEILASFERKGSAAVRIIVLRPRVRGDPLKSEAKFRRLGAAESAEVEYSNEPRLRSRSRRVLA